MGCVNITVEPHFVRSNISDEVLELSKKDVIYGVCDESFIVCAGEHVEFFGEIYKISQRTIERVS